LEPVKDGTDQGQESPGKKTIVLAALFLAAVVLLVGVWSFKPTGETASGPNWLPGTTPGPWQFDASGNRHWDPRSGHEHWHNGPPPPEGARVEEQAQPMPQAPSQAFKPGLQTEGLPKDPKPWQYDPATNQHFDPRPGHGHWHQGQPPPEDQRK